MVSSVEQRVDHGQPGFESFCVSDVLAKELGLSFERAGIGHEHVAGSSVLEPIDYSFGDQDLFGFVPTFVLYLGDKFLLPFYDLLVLSIPHHF
jgi:hypothetical protein